MKVYISADIEGVAGIATFREAGLAEVGYEEFRQQMVRETAAACRAAFDSGATDVVVQDSHGTGCNLLGRELPRPARLVRCFNGHPLSMLQGLTDDFAAVVMVGWHAAAGAGGNPLAHTLSSRNIQQLRLDGVVASEFVIHTHAAAMLGVPVICVAGDATLCREVERFDAAIETVPVKDAAGSSTTSLHPDDACDAIARGVRAALAIDPGSRRVRAPGRTTCEIDYKDATFAWRASWFPGAESTAPNTVQFAHDDYFEVLRFLAFCT